MNQPDGNTDFSTTTTAEILEELGRRSEAVLCILYHDRSNEIDHTTVFTRGQNPLVIGLIEMAKYSAQARLLDRGKPPSGFET